jgi:MORN repeat
MREGIGKITWNNGAVYVGDYKNDKEGRGTYSCAD